jgi:DNA polymerase (family X)
MNNLQISAALEQIADLLEFQGANPFRTRAYRNAARTLKDLTEQVTSLLAEKKILTDIPGVGVDLAEKIKLLAETGSLPMLDELRAAVPESVLALLRIPGLGPKKAASLFNDLKITSLEQLKAACEAGQVRDLKGFGKKTEETILKGLDFAAEAEKRIYWAEADSVVQDVLEHLKGVKAIKQIAAAGSYRRGKETVGDLDFLVAATSPDAAMDKLATYDQAATILARGETKMSVRLSSGLQIDLRVVPHESFGAALQYFTGSKEHNVILRGMAKNRGLKINEWGIFRVTGKGDSQKEEYLAGETEEEIYAALDLPCFPPEIREARQEFAWAEAGKLPKLIEVKDIVGDLHMHTNETDGEATLGEMIAAAQARGLKYIAITDHSQRVTMARGMDGKRLRAQWKAIDLVNEELDDFLVLKGVECDILEKGGMDLPDDVLAEADWVVASVHYGQNQPREQITDRILGALENPYVSAIGHPTGRLINRRAPYDVDLKAVFAAAVQYGKLLELNANPARLDLDDVASAAARQQGIPIVINTDAHSTSGLDVLRYGILQARRAGLTKADVANTLPWAKLKKLIGRKAN